jgi:hypothetical protein
MTPDLARAAGAIEAAAGLRVGDGQEVDEHLVLIAGMLVDCSRQAFLEAYLLACRRMQDPDECIRALAHRFAIGGAQSAPLEGLRRACERLCIRHGVVAENFYADSGDAA